MSKKHVFSEDNPFIFYENLKEFKKGVDLELKKPVYLITGQNFREAIKKLNANCTAIVFTYANPPSGVSTINLGVPAFNSTTATGNSDIVAWNDGDTVFISGKDRPIYINQTSSFMFGGWSTAESLLALKYIYFDNFHTDYAVNLELMFANCANLEFLDLSGWNTGNFSSLRYFIADCKKIKHINFEGWDTQKVTDISYLVQGCISLKGLDLSMFSTPKVTAIDGICNGSTNLRAVNLSNLIVTNVKSANNVFKNCSNLSKIYANSWTDNINVTTGVSFFDGCTKLPNFSSSAITGAKATPNGGYFTDPSEFSNVPGLNAEVANKVDKVNGSGLISDTDKTQITTNKNNIANLTSRVSTVESTLNGLATTLEAKVDALGAKI